MHETALPEAPGAAAGRPAPLLSTPALADPRPRSTPKEQRAIFLGSPGKGGVKMGAQAVPDLCHKVADTSLLLERRKPRLNSDENLQKTELCCSPPPPPKLEHSGQVLGWQMRVRATGPRSTSALCTGPARLQAEPVTAQGCGCPQPSLSNWGRGTETRQRNWM